MKIEMKCNENRKIGDNIHIETNDPLFCIKSIAQFLGNKMKTCERIIFQSEFGFMYSDVPFVMLIERDDSETGPYRDIYFNVKIIEADWQFYRNYIYGSDLPESKNEDQTFKDSKIYLKSWITCNELLDNTYDPSEQSTDPYKFFIEQFENYGCEFNCHSIDLMDDLYNYLNEYCDAYHLDKHDSYGVGGFIVCEDKLEEV